MSDFGWLLRGNYSVWMLTSFFVQSTIAIMLATWISRGRWEMSPAKRHTLWLATMLFVACIPLQSKLSVPAFAAQADSEPLADQRPETGSVQAEIAVPTAISNPSLPRGHAVTFAAADMTYESRLRPTADTAAEPRSTRSRLNGQRTRLFLIWAFRIWCVGVAMGILRVVHGVTTLRMIVRASNLCTARTIIQTASHVSREVGLRHPPALHVSDRVSTPLTIGLFKPTLILPSGVDRLAPKSLSHVMYHEFGHIRRCDAWVGILQRAILIVFWPQPFLRYASRQLNRAREELCDNFALNATQTREYAETLLLLARDCRIQPIEAYGFSLFDLRWNLESRVNAILADTRDRRQRSNRLTRAAIGSFTVFLFVSCGSLSLQLAPAVAQQPQQQADGPDKQSSLGQTHTVPPTATDSTAVADKAERAAVPKTDGLADVVPADVTFFASISNLDSIRAKHPEISPDILGQLCDSFCSRERFSQQFGIRFEDCLSRDISALAIVERNGELLVVLQAKSKREAAALKLRLGGANANAHHRGTRCFVASSERMLESVGNVERASETSLGNSREFQAAQDRTSLASTDGTIVRWIRGEFAATRLRGKGFPFTEFEYEGGTIQVPSKANLAARHRTFLELQPPWRDSFRDGAILFDRQHHDPERWVPAHAATYATLHLDLQNSLPFLQAVIDEFVDSTGFCDAVLNSFRHDRNGPQVDIRQRLFAHLGNRVSYAAGIDGDINAWVIAVHVTDQAKVDATVRQIFERDPQADAPESVGETGTIIRTRREKTSPEARETLKNGLKLDTDGHATSWAGAIAIWEDQLMIGSSYEVLWNVLKTQGREPPLRDNAAFISMAKRLSLESKLASGRFYSIDQQVAIPPFLPKLWALFFPDFDKREFFVPLTRQTAALALKKTQTGMQVNGCVFSLLAKVKQPTTQR